MKMWKKKSSYWASVVHGHSKYLLATLTVNTLLIIHSIYNNNCRIKMHTTYSTLFRIAVYVLSITLRISLLTPHGAVCHSEMVQPSCSIDNPYVAS